jgi:hypothetical protein
MLKSLGHSQSEMRPIPTGLAARFFATLIVAAARLWRKLPAPNNTASTFIRTAQELFEFAEKFNGDVETAKVN